VGLWSVSLACLKDTGQQSGDPACLWIPGLTGLEGHGAAEQRSCVWGSLAWQALGAQAWGVNIVSTVQALGACPSRMEIVWVCTSSTAGLGGIYQQSRHLARLCRPWGCNGQNRDHAGLWGTAQPNGAPVGLCRPGGREA
jgi:hypothetical protein